jgi:hypothetical protein
MPHSSYTAAAEDIVRSEGQWKPGSGAEPIMGSSKPMVIMACLVRILWMLMDWLKGNWRRTTFFFFAGLRWFNPQKTAAFLWNPLKTFHRMNGHEAQAIFWMFSGAGPGARFADVSAMSAFGRVNQAPHGTPWRRFGSQRVAASSFHNSLLSYHRLIGHGSRAVLRASVGELSGWDGDRQEFKLSKLCKCRSL